MASPEEKPCLIKQLAADIKNTVWHVFGHHGNCSSDFCKSSSKSDTTTNTSSSKQPDWEALEEEEDQEEDDIMTQQWRYWIEGTTEEEMEEVRVGGTSPEHIQAEIIHEVMKIMNKVANMADVLINNVTTNLCEAWMGIRAKFDGGKVIDRCKASSWYTRCWGAGLRRNIGPQWSTQVWQQVTGLQPTRPFIKYHRHLASKLQHSRNSKAKPEVRKRAFDRKNQSTKQASSKRARLSYGEEVVAESPDVEADVLITKMETFMQNSISICNRERVALAKETELQSDCGRWHLERAKRVTASSVGEIIRRNPKRKIEPIVRRMLYPSFTGNASTRHGQNNEQQALTEYVARQNNSSPTSPIKVVRTGFHIHPKKNWLGASPDGLVVEGGWSWEWLR